MSWLPYVSVKTRRSRARRQRRTHSNKKEEAQRINWTRWKHIQIMPLKDLPTEIWINIARHFYGTHTNDLNAQEDLLRKWPRKYQNIAHEVIFEHPIVRTSEVCRFLRGYIQYPGLRERTTEMSIVFDRRHGRPLSCFEHRSSSPQLQGVKRTVAVAS
jgi:hypothetical protein